MPLRCCCCCCCCRRRCCCCLYPLCLPVLPLKRMHWSVKRNTMSSSKGQARSCGFRPQQPKYRHESSWAYINIIVDSWTKYLLHTPASSTHKPKGHTTIGAQRDTHTHPPCPRSIPCPPFSTAVESLWDEGRTGTRSAEPARSSPARKSRVPPLALELHHKAW